MIFANKTLPTNNPLPLRPFPPPQKKYTQQFTLWNITKYYVKQYRPSLLEQNGSQADPLNLDKTRNPVKSVGDSWKPSRFCESSLRRTGILHLEIVKIVSL